MKQLYFFITITIFMYSCVSENEQVVLNQIKELYETQDVIASYGFDYDTNGKKVNYIEINIKGSPVINSEGYNPELAASTSALSWYNSLNEEQLKDYNTIIVNIESNNKTNKFEYLFDHISDINSSYNFLESYLNKIKNKDYSSALKDIDTVSFSGIKEQDLKEMYESISRELGMFKEYKFHGFGVHQAELNDGEIDCIFIWTTSYYEKDNVNVLYLLDLKDKSDRLIGFQSM